MEQPIDAISVDRLNEPLSDLSFESRLEVFDPDGPLQGMDVPRAFLMRLLLPEATSRRLAIVDSDFTSSEAVLASFECPGSIISTDENFVTIEFDQRSHNGRVELRKFPLSILKISPDRPLRVGDTISLKQSLIKVGAHV